MRKIIASHSLGILMAFAFWGATISTKAVSYYVHPVTGDDSNPGTSSLAPFRTLSRASKLHLEAGDHLFLAGGQTFSGQLAFEGITGIENFPIVISSYQSNGETNSFAIIDARGCSAGVLLSNCRNVQLQNLSISANGRGTNQTWAAKADMRCGVLIQVDGAGEFSDFSISNLVVKDIFFEDPGFTRNPDEARSANGTQSYGWGIRFINTSPDAVMKDISIRDCRIENVSHTGLKFTAPSNGIRNVEVNGIQIAHTGGPGVQMSGVCGGHFSHLEVNGSGSKSDTRNWKRGSGLWTWGSSDVVIEKSRFQNANGPGDSAGVHIDFNCHNVIVQYNFSANNAGGFCEILGNNYNCAYRYNISVNDGRRVKGKEGAFQEGKTFWLSGYTGDRSPRTGPFNTYFYNNTIYLDDGISAKIAVAPTTEGLLIANNVFCIKGASQMVTGDQLRQDLLSTASIPNVVFTNNLYLKPENWPAALAIQDVAPLIGDPQFLLPGGLNLDDYIPRNVLLVKNRGIRIPHIPGDPVGLVGGLKPDRDILGRHVLDTPDLGAVEITDESKPQLGLK